MKIIKLNAIDSTSSFLKKLVQNSAVENYTVVVADEQIKGRGQQKNIWVSEPFKNLTMSVFISDFDLKLVHQKYLNFAISLAIYNTLSNKNIPKLSIKWPNDIMSVHKKICGILIENTVKNNLIKHAIIGIGLNVNQLKFNADLKNITSLKKITKVNFDLNDLLIEIINNIKIQIQHLSLKKYDELETEYLNVLYKKNIPTMFKNSKNVLFMGKIIGISAEGNLQIMLENETIETFGIKEVSIA